MGCKRQNINLRTAGGLSRTPIEEEGFKNHPVT